MASNCLGVAPLKTARLWFRAEKKTIEVQQPHLIHRYNKNMGGVDQMDRNIGKLRPAIPHEKVVVATFFMAARCVYAKCMASVSACSNEQGLDALDFSGFTRRVALCYSSSGEQTSRGRPSTRMTTSYKVLLPEVRYDRLDHLIVSIDKQVRCALCNKKLQRMCQKCKV